MAITESLELVQGTLDVLILKTLSWGPRHGYAVARWLWTASDDVLRVEEGALYPALHRLERPWMDRERVGPLGEQPARQVLPAHPRRPAAAPGEGRHVDPICRRGDQGARRRRA